MLYCTVILPLLPHYFYHCHFTLLIVFSSLLPSYLPQTCRDLIRDIYQFPMVVVDAEYQFDRHKLTVYYDADHRVDFTEFVKHIYEVRAIVICNV